LGFRSTLRADRFDAASGVAARLRSDATLRRPSTRLRAVDAAPPVSRKLPSSSSSSSSSSDAAAAAAAARARWMRAAADGGPLRRTSGMGVGAADSGRGWSRSRMSWISRRCRSWAYCSSARSRELMAS